MWLQVILTKSMHTCILSRVYVFREGTGIKQTSIPVLLRVIISSKKILAFEYALTKIKCQAGFSAASSGCIQVLYQQENSPQLYSNGGRKMTSIL